MAAAARKLQYNVPNYSFTGLSVFTNHVTGGAFRGYGNTQLTFGREILMDRLAQKLDMDPVEFRLMNHVQVASASPARASLSAATALRTARAAASRSRRRSTRKNP